MFTLTSRYESFSINSNLLKARSIEEDQIQDAKFQCEVVKAKMIKVNDEIHKSLDLRECQGITKENIVQKITQLTKAIASEEAKATSVGTRIQKISSTMNVYEMALEHCMNKIQDPNELRAILTNMHEFYSSNATPNRQLVQPDDVQRSNEIMTNILDLKRQLEELKATESAMTKNNKEERLHQIKLNAKLLEQISSKKLTKCSSGQLSGVIKTTNNKRLSALSKKI